MKNMTCTLWFSQFSSEEQCKYFSKLSVITTHAKITLANDQLEAKFLYFYNTFITVFYMFRATSCSSSGGQILLIQYLVWSLSVIGLPVHVCTGRPLTESDDTRCSINTIQPPDDEHIIFKTCKGL